MVGGGGGAWGGHCSPICDFLGDLCFAQTKAENPDLGHAVQVVCHLLTVDRVAVWVEFRIWCKNILLLFNVLVKRTGDNQVTAVLVSRSSYFDYFHNDCCSLPVLRKKPNTLC